VQLTVRALAQLPEAFHRFRRGCLGGSGSGKECLRDQPRLDQVARTAKRRHQLWGRACLLGQLVVAQRADGFDRKALEPRQVEVDVPSRQAELLEVATYGLRGKPVLAELAQRAGAVALRELRSVLADHQAVVDVLRRL